MTPKGHKRKKGKNQLPFIIIKNFCYAKDNMKRMQRQAADWEELFANHVSYKELISRIQKNSGNSTVKQSN